MAIPLQDLLQGDSRYTHYIKLFEDIQFYFANSWKQPKGIKDWFQNGVITDIDVLGEIFEYSLENEDFARYFRERSKTFWGELSSSSLISVHHIDLTYPGARIQSAHLFPNLNLFENLLSGKIPLDTLSWREFEEFIAELLQKDGYHVELGSGQRDGGKDIVAVKELEGLGTFMSIWQAKKPRPGKKVGIEVIRELADTRNECGASKGIIVTTTFLTFDALERIRKDQYLLGKVDRNDLLLWMRRLR